MVCSWKRRYAGWYTSNHNALRAKTNGKRYVWGWSSPRMTAAKETPLCQGITATSNYPTICAIPCAHSPSLLAGITPTTYRSCGPPPPPEDDPPPAALGEAQLIGKKKSASWKEESVSMGACGTSC